MAQQLGQHGGGGGLVGGLQRQFEQQGQALRQQRRLGLDGGQRGRLQPGDASRIASRGAVVQRRAGGQQHQGGVVGPWLRQRVQAVVRQQGRHEDRLCGRGLGAGGQVFDQCRVIPGPVQRGQRSGVAPVQAGGHRAPVGRRQVLRHAPQRLPQRQALVAVQVGIKVGDQSPQRGARIAVAGQAGEVGGIGLAVGEGQPARLGARGALGKLQHAPIAPQRAQP